MATGPEHYRKAEELLGYLGQCFKSGETLLQPAVMANVAMAQAHATLALAAALGTLDATEGPNGGSTLGRTSRDAVEWDRIAGYDGAGGHR